MSIWFILKNLVWICRECKNYWKWATWLYIYPNIFFFLSNNKIWINLIVWLFTSCLKNKNLLKVSLFFLKNKPKLFVICHLQKSWIKTTQLMIWLKMGHKKKWTNWNNYVACVWFFGKHYQVYFLSRQP